MVADLVAEVRPRLQFAQFLALLVRAIRTWPATRLAFIAGLGSAAAWPLAAHWQQTPEVTRIGFVYAGSKAAAALRIQAILSGLRVSGYAAPAQVEIVARTAEGDPAQIGNEAIGAIAMYRQEVRPFSDKHIDLVANFANRG